MSSDWPGNGNGKSPTMSFRSVVRRTRNSCVRFAYKPDSRLPTIVLGFVILLVHPATLRPSSAVIHLSM